MDKSIQDLFRSSEMPTVSINMLIPPPQFLMTYFGLPKGRSPLSSTVVFEFSAVTGTNFTTRVLIACPRTPGRSSIALLLCRPTQRAKRIPHISFTGG